MFWLEDLMMKDESRFVRLEEWEAERMRDPEFVAALTARDPASQAARLRILRGLTQAQLAELAGAKLSPLDDASAAQL